jgi:hypothetical protein
VGSPNRRRLWEINAINQNEERNVKVLVLNLSVDKKHILAEEQEYQ